jgi:hypothetical protein
LRSPSISRSQTNRTASPCFLAHPRPSTRVGLICGAEGNRGAGEAPAGSGDWRSPSAVLIPYSPYTTHHTNTYNTQQTTPTCTHWPNTRSAAAGRGRAAKEMCCALCPLAVRGLRTADCGLSYIRCWCFCSVRAELLPAKPAICFGVPTNSLWGPKFSAMCGAAELAA